MKPYLDPRQWYSARRSRILICGMSSCESKNEIRTKMRNLYYLQTKHYIGIRILHTHMPKFVFLKGNCRECEMYPQIRPSTLQAAALSSPLYTHIRSQLLLVILFKFTQMNAFNIQLSKAIPFAYLSLSRTKCWSWIDDNGFHAENLRWAHTQTHIRSAYATMETVRSFCHFACSREHGSMYALILSGR